MVHYLEDVHHLSRRRACKLVGCNRKTSAYLSVREDDPGLREKLMALAQEHRAWGYRLLCGALRLAGFSVNHKRVYRLYKEEDLQHRPRTRHRLTGEKKGHPPDPVAINEVWTMDFMSDALQNGRKIRTLNVIDAFTRQCLGVEVDTSLAGYRVKRVLARLIQVHGKPKRIQIDNGTEFRCKLLEAWAQEEDIELYFIDPGKPNQNGRIESFNSRLREECLNQEWFLNMAEARWIVERWRRHYNQERPHSSLKYLPPDEWTKRYLATPEPLRAALLPQKRNRGTDSGHATPSPATQPHGQHMESPEGCYAERYA